MVPPWLSTLLSRLFTTDLDMASGSKSLKCNHSNNSASLKPNLLIVIKAASALAKGGGIAAG